ncbi:MAG: PHP domain-containing protein [bacterium]|nr:PHP domain-containing protein [bacterium]
MTNREIACVFRGIVKDPSMKNESSCALLGDTLPFAHHLCQRLASVPGVKKIEIAGSLRRMKETVGDIDLVAVSAKPESLMKYFVSMSEVVQVQEHGTTRSIVHLSNGLDCDLRVVSAESFGSALLYFTGSKEHGIALCKIANEKGMTLNEYGLYKENDGKKGAMVANKTEKEIYDALGLVYIEPELREMTGEIESAKQNTLQRLVSYKSLHGDFQVQSDWSDGEDSIEELAMSAQRAGLSYIAITDHTKSLTVANGLDEKRLEKQSRLIDRLNKKFHGITILKGSEVDILKDGSLDISDTALSRLDLVGISVHSYFNLSKDEQTKRIIKAMSHPSVNILFHPTTRRINRREECDMDLDEIYKAAKKYNVVLEINASPSRLDLKDVHIHRAQEYGCMFSIDSDAHNAEHFSFLQYGIGQARRGWLSEENILNTRTVKEVKKVLSKKR